MRTRHEEMGLMEEGAMRVEDAIAWSGIGRSTMYKLIAKGSIPSVRAGGRRLIPTRGLKEYLASRVEGGDSIDG